MYDSLLGRVRHARSNQVVIRAIFASVPLVTAVDRRSVS
jgi:hypothetical protein